MKANNKMGDVFVKWYPLTYDEDTQAYDTEYAMDAEVRYLGSNQVKKFHLSAPTTGELWAKLLERLGWHLEELPRGDWTAQEIE